MATADRRSAACYWVRAGDHGTDEPIAAPVDWELIDDSDRVVAQGREEGIKTR